MPNLFTKKTHFQYNPSKTFIKIYNIIKENTFKFRCHCCCRLSLLFIVKTTSSIAKPNEAVTFFPLHRLFNMYLAKYLATN